MKKLFYTLTLLSCIGCAGKSAHQQSQQLTSIQFVDRNGFKETINAQDRLATYEQVSFLSPQPYEKITRMYKRNEEGKTRSRITSYHENGEPKQYLDVVNGRACGTYREWYSNGVLRLDVSVMEGLGDLSEEGQMNWIFDGLSRVWDEQGNLAAEIYYEKGALEGNSLYYYPNGALSKCVPYSADLIHGEVILYTEKGDVKGKIPFQRGQEHGIATFKGDDVTPPYSEEHQNGFLMRATYHDFDGSVVASIHGGKGEKAIFDKGFLACIEEYQNGVQCGKVKLFDREGHLTSTYTAQDSMKHGPEWVYFSNQQETPPQPKLYIEWDEDRVHGLCRSWYPNGLLESEKEMSDNKKEGVSTAWYQDGSLMFIEEYEGDILKTGRYMKRGETSPVSQVTNGEGVANLFDGKGSLLRRVEYKEGLPVGEAKK